MFFTNAQHALKEGNWTLKLLSIDKLIMFYLYDGYHLVLPLSLLSPSAR